MSNPFADDAAEFTPLDSSAARSRSSSRSQVGVPIERDDQAIIDSLRAEAAEAASDEAARVQEEAYSKSLADSLSYRDAPGAGALGVGMDEDDPYGDGEPAGSYRTRARSGYVPPRARGSSQSQSEITVPLSSLPSSVSSNFGADRLRSPTTFSHNFDRQPSPRPSSGAAAAAGSGGKPPGVSGGSAAGAGATGTLVSATDMERNLLEAPAHHASPLPGPLLLQYSQASSSIRKDFTTVDWFFSKSNMHRVRRAMRAANKRLGWQGKLKNWILAGQGWVILFLVGVLSAMTAYIIHHVSSWLSDLKGGYCHGHNIFATRRVCCMDEQSALDPSGEGLPCQAWYSWNHGVAANGSHGATFWNLMIYTILATLFGCGGSWVCVVYAKQAAGSGIAELKIVLGGFVIKKFLGIRTLFLKSVGLTLAVASGMALGKEGPMVHIACAWGHILSRPFTKYRSNEVKKVEVLSAGVAAGVTAAFGSPLGGVLFALEVTCSYFPPKTMWRSFWCAICAALVLQWLDPFQTGKLVQFAVSGLNWQWFELVPFAFLGALGGVLGALFNKLNVKATKFRKGSAWLKANPVYEVCIIACVTALISFPNIFTRGNSGSLLAQLFSSCGDQPVEDDNDRNQGSNSVMAALCDDNHAAMNMFYLLLACALKFLLTTITYGSAIPSGVFMPSLCVGALMGRTLGWMMMLWHRSVGDTSIFAICAGKSQCVAPALYAVIGAASVLGGITRMTVALAVIMFEVTGGLETIVPIMVAVVCSKWFGDALGKQGLYGCLIELNGLPHIDTHSEVDLVNPAAEMMAREPVCLLTYGETLASVQQVIAEYGFHGFPIIDNAKDKLVVGFIARSDLEMLLDRVTDEENSRAESLHVHFAAEAPPSLGSLATAPHLDFSESVDKHPLVVRPSMPADRVMTMFQALGLRYVLCCSPRGRIMGIIKKKDLLSFLANHNIKHK